MLLSPETRSIQFCIEKNRDASFEAYEREIVMVYTIRFIVIEYRESYLFALIRDNDGNKLEIMEKNKYLKEIEIIYIYIYHHLNVSKKKRNILKNIINVRFNFQSSLLSIEKSFSLKSRFRDRIGENDIRRSVVQTQFARKTSIHPYTWKILDEKFAGEPQIRVKSYRIDEQNVQLEMREKPHERDCVLEAWREEEGGRRCIACSYRIYEFPILKRSRRERERVGANHGRWNFGFPGFVHYEILPGVGRASSFEFFARDNSRRV